MMIRLLGAAWHLSALAVLGRYLIVLFQNLRQLRRIEDESPATDPHPLVSILIPARNESGNLPRCLDSLLQQDYPMFDVTVLDDNSEDETSAVVATYARRTGHVRLIQGRELHDGWLGKPWACQQLGEQAVGEILLFLDADTWLEPGAVSRAAGIMQRERPGLLSVLPHQVTGTMAERLVLPGLYTAFLCNIPLWRMEDPAYLHDAAANGQFMCFDAGVYREVGGHAAVRREITEDLAFARIIKQSGSRLSARTAVELVHCRMYGSWREVLDGFSKNAYQAVGERPTWAAAYIALILMSQVLPFVVAACSGIRGSRSFLWFWLPLTETGLLVMIRLLVSHRMRFRRRDAPLAPLAGLAAAIIMVRSIWWKHRHGYQWKGRSLSPSA